MLLKNIKHSLFLIFLIVLSCKPSKDGVSSIKKIQAFEIDFSISVEQDSIVYKLKNPTYCSLRFYSKSNDVELNNFLKDSDLDKIVVKAQEELVIKKENSLKKSSKYILKNISKSAKYGDDKEEVKEVALALPFSKGKEYTLIQGNNTDFTHKYDRNRYSVDFRMNEGEALTAVYSGVVVAVVDGYTIGGRNKKLEEHGNYIMIYHDELGTYSTYYHLKPQGSIVKIGDRVKQNQLIGYSGHTGYSTEPHLHYCYSIATEKETTNNGLISIPIRFENNIISTDLKKGEIIKHYD